MVRSSDNKVWIKIRMEKSLLRRLNRLAARTGKTAGQIVEEALRYYVHQADSEGDLMQSHHVLQEVADGNDAE